MKVEFSKIILLCVGIMTLLVCAFAMFIMWHTADASALAYLIPSVFGEFAAATGFYYTKARAENEIKLRRALGSDTYDENKE